MSTYSFLQFYTATPKYTHAPGLDVMRALMDRLGNPQTALRCVHIAGTNGKGSCASMTASVLQAAGYRTGLFTSPDLCGMEERIRINGVNIILSDFQSVTARVKAACEGLDEPSYFEKITAAAFLYFAEQHCDYVVLETGLGGRLDATNILKNPVCSVIMPIGFDHMGVLGDDLSSIAREKAGIIKPGIAVVCAPQSKEAETILSQTAKERNCPLYMVDINLISSHTHSPAGQIFSYKDMTDIELRLLGAHQVQNACAVIETARILGIEEPAVREGLKSAYWPCRFEFIPGNPPFLLDGAHNAHGASALSAGLRDYFPGQKFTMVMGVMADKDYTDILAFMEPLASRFVCLAPDSPRAMPPEELAALIQNVPAETADSAEEAIMKARTYGDPVCAFGSLYYIGTVRNLLL